MALAPVILTAPLFEQVDWLLPATAVGAAVIVNVLLDVAFAHGLFPVAVRVSVTEPAVISDGLGVYVAVVNELALANVPVPLDVHVIVP